MQHPPLRRAYLVSLLERLTALVIEQGEEAIRHSDIPLPPRATATFIHVAKHGPVSASDIAGAFDQPHQLVAQRIDLLLEAGLIARTPDPRDSRRKLLKLTPKGKTKLDLLMERLVEAE